MGRKLLRIYTVPGGPRFPQPGFTFRTGVGTACGRAAYLVSKLSGKPDWFSRSAQVVMSEACKQGYDLISQTGLVPPGQPYWQPPEQFVSIYPSQRSPQYPRQPVPSIPDQPRTRSPGQPPSRLLPTPQHSVDPVPQQPVIPEPQSPTKPKPQPAPSPTGQPYSPWRQPQTPTLTQRQVPGPKNPQPPTVITPQVPSPPVYQTPYPNLPQGYTPWHMPQGSLPSPRQVPTPPGPTQRPSPVPQPQPSYQPPAPQPSLPGPKQSGYNPWGSWQPPLPTPSGQPPSPTSDGQPPSPGPSGQPGSNVGVIPNVNLPGPVNTHPGGPTQIPGGFSPVVPIPGDPLTLVLSPIWVTNFILSFFGTTAIQAQKRGIQDFFTPIFKRFAKETGLPLRDNHFLQFDYKGVKKWTLRNPVYARLREELLKDTTVAHYLSMNPGPGLTERIINQFVTNVAINGWDVRVGRNLWQGVTTAINRSGGR